MYESFDMACRDTSSALRLDIKVNSENLLPASSSTCRYNASSLKIPADPSWPKIPSRRLVEDVGDIIESPCVVTLVGSPRRSRTVVKAPYNEMRSRSPQREPAIANQKVPNNQHSLKWRPGCLDPRFKKVTSVKSQMTPADPVERLNNNLIETSRSAAALTNQITQVPERIGRTIPARDIDVSNVTQDVAEKPGEIRAVEDIAVQTVRSNKENKLENAIDNDITNKEKNQSNVLKENVTKDKNCTDELHAKGRRASISGDMFSLRNEKEIVDTAQVIVSAPNLDKASVLNVPQNVACNANPNQINNGQLFLLFEQGLETNSIPQFQCTAQCYNVQVPVLSYQNIPVQLTSTHGQASIAGQPVPTPILTIPPSAALDFTKRDSVKPMQPNMGQTLDEKYQRCADLQYNLKVEETVQNCQTFVPSSCSDTAYGEMPQNHLAQVKRKNSTVHCAKDETSRKLTYKVKSCTKYEYHETTDSGSDALEKFHQPRKSIRETYDGRNCLDSDCTESNTESRHNMKSEPNSSYTKIYSAKNHTQYSESKVTAKCKKSRANFEKETKPFLKRGSQDIINATVTANGDSSRKVVEQITSTETPRSDTLTGNNENSTSIPLKTQELLNKSYWEYYNKLQCEKSKSIHEKRHLQELSVEVQDIKKSKNNLAPNQEYHKSPERKILEQCTVLSTMINQSLKPTLKRATEETLQTKQLYKNGNMNSSTDPTGETHSAIVKKITLKNQGNNYKEFLGSSIANKSTEKLGKCTTNGMIKLKTIVIFLCIIYTVIVFLPMIYEYIYYEDSREYNDLGYVKLTLHYIVSSYKAAFGGIFDFFHNIFVRPVRRN